MAWEQAVGGWHWGQLIIACVVVCTLSFLVGGRGIDLIEQGTSLCQFSQNFAECVSSAQTKENLGWVLAVLGLVVGPTVLLTILWVWFGARRPENVQ